MASFSTTTTICIRVPNQEFGSIRLVVSGNTTLKQVHEEVREQLAYSRKSTAYYKNHHPEQRLTCLRAHNSTTGTDWVHFMMNWTVEQVLDHGVKDFELVFLDLI